MDTILIIMLVVVVLLIVYTFFIKDPPRNYGAPDSKYFNTMIPNPYYYPQGMCDQRLMEKVYNPVTNQTYPHQQPYQFVRYDNGNIKKRPNDKSNKREKESESNMKIEYTQILNNTIMKKNKELFRKKPDNTNQCYQNNLDSESYNNNPYYQYNNQYW